MRALLRTLPLCAALVAGCDGAVTRPADRVASKPSEILLRGSGWTRIDLPFTPGGMNDAGVVVGTQGAEAVRWENGTLTVLPHRSGVAGPYRASAITPKGMILGYAGFYTTSHGLYWLLPTAAPNDFSMDPFWGFVPVYVVGINDNYEIVGEKNLTGQLQAFRWTPTTGFRTINRGPQTTYVTGINASGYIAGYESPDVGPAAAVRWSPTNVATVLPVPSGQSSPIAVGINDAGVTLGWGNTLPYAWGLNNGYSVVPGPAQYPHVLTSAGRIAGNEVSTNRPFTTFNGSTTYLSVSSTRASVNIQGVSSCGDRILGARVDTVDAGYLWVRSGIFVQCDQTPVVTIGGLTTAP